MPTTSILRGRSRAAPSIQVQASHSLFWRSPTRTALERPPHPDRRGKPAASADSISETDKRGCQRRKPFYRTLSHLQTSVPVYLADIAPSGRHRYVEDPE